MTKTGNRKAALTFLRKAMRRYGRPETIVTDKLGSYRAAMSQIGNAARQETGRWLNNRAELTPAHATTRTSDAALPAHAKSSEIRVGSFLRAQHFNQERHLYSRKTFKLNRAAALAEWREFSAA